MLFAPCVRATHTANENHKSSIAGTITSLEWKNLLHTIRQQDLDDLLIVFPLDKESEDFVSEGKVAFNSELVSDN